MNEPIQKPSLNLFRRSCILYLIMILVSLFVCGFFQKNLTTLFYFPLSGKGLLHFLAITGLTTGIILAIGQVFEMSFASYRMHRLQLKLIIGKITFLSSFVLALLAAAGEELLFRAVVQEYIGIFFTSMLVGLLHISPQGLLTAWTCFGVINSLLLGVIFHHTHSIIPNLIVHFIVNFSYLLRLLVWEKQMTKSAETSSNETQKDKN